MRSTGIIRTVVFAASCFVLATPTVAQIDMTGRWAISGDAGLFEDAFDQDGTVLSSFFFGVGTIDPSTGIFHLERPGECTLPGDDDPSTIDGTVSADGLTFTGSFSVLVIGTPSNPCVRFDGVIQGARVALQTILGKSFAVKDPQPGDPSKRTIVASAKERASTNTLVGDPVSADPVGGAILWIYAKGATPSSQKFVLPQGTRSNGQPFWSGSPTSGFKYKDPRGEQGPVKKVIIKLSPGGIFSIKAMVSGKHGAVSVVPPNPGTDGCIALDLGVASGAPGDRYSVQFGTESTIANGATSFKASKPTAEGHCVGTL